MSEQNYPELNQTEQIAKVLSPRPAQLITLPAYMECHDHSYTQIVIGLKGQAEFEVCGNVNISRKLLKRPKLKQKTSFNGFERKYNKCQYK